MADTSVKFFHSDLPGAPVLSGSAGALIGILDACLVAGFGLKTVDTLSVANEVATAAISTGHSFEPGSVALIAGATPAALNGEQRIIATTGTSVTFAAPGLSDQTASGSITAKLAPAGWAKPHSGSNLAAFAITDPAGSGCCLRLDDTNAQYVRAVAYETMSDVNTGSGPFPTAAQASGGAYLAKSNAAGSAARKWMIAADSRAVILMLAYHGSYADAYTSYFFGDFLSRKVGDGYGCMLVAETAGYASSTNIGENAGNLACGGLQGWIARDYTAVSQALTSFTLPAGYPASIAYKSGASTFPAYPSPIDGRLAVSRVWLTEGSTYNNQVRGEFPGFLASLNYCATTHFLSRTRVDAEGDLAGRTLLAVQYRSHENRFFVDVTGPWR